MAPCRLRFAGWAIGRAHSSYPAGLDLRANVQWPLFTGLHAAFNGSKDVTELLLANDADVNAMDDKRETPLDVMAFNGHQDVVELLRQHGGHE